MASVFRFGRFDLDAATGELRKDGRVLKLPPQPSRVLVLLVRRAGQIVSQDEIRREVWGEDTFVDFEAGLHYCLTRIRNALGEKHTAPRFIETLPRRGYRFIAAVEEHREPGAIAVLPFANLNADPAFDYFADGVSDALITELGCVAATRVISRQSTLQFRGSARSVAEIARALDVDVIVEGSALHAGDRVRVTAQLIQVDPERHLWAQAYDCRLADILALQREVASAIAGQINRALAGGTPVPAARQTRPEAYEAYLRGRFHEAAWTREGLARAVEYYQRAVDLEPQFALPHAGLANAYALLAYWNHLPSVEALPKAKAAALKALALDERLSAAHAALGRIVLWQDWDAEQSEREIARAIELNPSDEQARMQRALDAASLRQDDALALSEMREALRLDPLSVATGSLAAWVLFFLRQYPRAIQQAHATLEMHPLSLQAFYVLGLATCMMGRPDLAIPALERAVQISPVPLSSAYLAFACARAGDKPRARALLDQLLALPPDQLVSTKPLVIVYTALGEMDQAFECLERGFEARDTVLFSVLSIAVYDGLRPDSRFDPLVARVRATAGIAAPV
jgi:TolB-like protein/Tfp pilus assembly protein PilF